MINGKKIIKLASMHVHSFRPKIIPLNATRLFSIHKCSMNIFISKQNIKYHKNERKYFK